MEGGKRTIEWNRLAQWFVFPSSLKREQWDLQKRNWRRQIENWLCSMAQEEMNGRRRLGRTKPKVEFRRGRWV